MSAPYLAIDVPDDAPAGVVNRTAVVGLDATSATVGQVVTAVDDPDNPGRTVASFQDAGTDPGVPTGEPGNLALTLSAGDGIVCTAHDAPTRIPEFATSPVALNLTNVGALKLVCPIIAAGPPGTKIGILGIRYAGDTPTLLGAFVAADAVNTIDGVDWATQGAYVALDPSFHIPNVHLCPVIYDGDDAGEVILGNVYLFAVSVDADTPPTPETPDPEVPTEGIIAEWLLTEGSGQTVANKAVGGVTADLISGTAIGVDANEDFVWETSPRRMRFESTAFGSDYRVAHYPLPSAMVATGCAIVMYVELTTIGGGTKYLCGIRTLGGSGVNDHYLRVASGAAASVIVNQLSPSTNITVTGSTLMANGGKHLLALIHVGTMLYLGVDGVIEASAACTTADDNTLRTLILGQGGYAPTAESGPDVWRCGDPRFWTGSAGAIAVRDNFAEIAAVYRTTYPDIPVP